MRPTLQHLQPTHAASPHAHRAPLANRAWPALAAVCVLALAAFVTLASAPSPTRAATLASKRAQAAELDAQVAKIERRYDELQERYRGAEYELDRIRGEVKAAHRVVVASKKDLGVARGNLAERSAAIYRSGGPGSEIAELVAAGSFSDFFARIDTKRRVGDQDANVLDRVEALNAKVEKKERILRTAKDRAAKAAERARKDKVAMQGVLDERRAKLDSVNADIRAIMEEQRRAAEAAAAAAARETAALADTTGGARSGDGGGEGSGSGGGSSSGGSSGGSGGGGGSSIPLPPGSGTAAAAASAAMGKLGSPYVWAASGPDSFDCSGLVVWAFAQAGRPGLPHSTYALVNMGVSVPMDQLQVGDLLFSSSVGHMGIYVGNNSFVHAPHTGDVVKVTSLSDYGLSIARRI